MRAVAADAGDARLTVGLKGVKGFGLRGEFAAPAEGDVVRDNFFMLCARSKVERAGEAAAGE
jgi:hypothetical protein